VLIAEDLLVLLVDRSCGELPKHKGTQTALAAAVLIEVASSGRLAIDPPTVTIVADAPLTDPILDAVRKPGTVPELIAAIIPGLHRRLLDRLTEQGVLTKSTRWWTMGLVPRAVWRPADSTHRDDLRRTLATVLLGRSEPNVRTGALITLATELGVFDILLDDHYDEAARRAEEITASDWPADEVTKAIVAASKESVTHWAMTDDFDGGYSY
jgi:hypothetical protein